LHSAVDAAATAAGLWQQDGDELRLVRALVTLSRQQWLTERTVAALGSAERALELGLPLGDSYQNALATLNLGRPAALWLAALAPQSAPRTSPPASCASRSALLVFGLSASPSTRVPEDEAGVRR
jgi:hypothetical protein